MRRHMVGKELSRRWERDRKDAKRAEARLSLGLLRLEECRLYRMNTVAREQRQLQKELEKLRRADNSKKRFSSFGNVLLGTQKKSKIPMIPQQGGQRHRTAEPDGIRTETHLLQTKEYKISKPIRIPSLYPIDCIKNNEEAFSQSPMVSLGGGPNASKTNSVTIINPHQDRDSISLPQGTSAKPQKPETFSKASGAPPSESEVTEIMEASPGGGVSPKPGKQNSTPGREMPIFDPKAYTLYSYLRTVDTMPTYLELFAKAKNARYLRHRVPPEFERELSIGEIFGHAYCPGKGV